MSEKYFRRSYYYYLTRAILRRMLNSSHSLRDDAQLNLMQNERKYSN